MDRENVQQTENDCNKYFKLWTSFAFMRYGMRECLDFIYLHTLFSSFCSVFAKGWDREAENIQFIALNIEQMNNICFALQIYYSIHILTFSFFYFCDFNVFAGNVFVIAAILLEKNLQSVANYLILSLAVADLLVACLVMPLSAVYEISREWKLGPELCDMWTSSDVLCCTASILHLVAIALDR